MNVARLSRIQQWMLAATCPVAVLLVFPSALEPFQLPKAVAVVALAGTLTILTLARLVARSQLQVPASPAVVAAVVFGVAAVIVSMLGDAPALSLAGVWGRHSGALLYCAGIAIFLIASLVMRDTDPTRIMVAIAVTGAVTGVYTILQNRGLDPLAWQHVFDSAAFGTLGNPNFAAALLGISLPCVVWLAYRSRHQVRSCGLLLVSAAVLVIGIWATQSQQGYVAGAAALGLLAWAWLQGRQTGLSRTLTWLLPGVGLLGVAGLGLGMWGVGPLAGVASRAGIGRRLFYWESAIDIFKEHPISGVGFDRFGAYYRAFRPAADAASISMFDAADAAHNVVLQFLAGGGLIVTLPYVAFVVTVFWALVRGLREAPSDYERVLLGAIGGAWVAYQTQALVSIDVPPLLVMNWLLAGVILARTRYGTWRIGLPGTTAEPRNRAARRRRSRSAILGNQWVVGLSILWLLMAILVAVPLRADFTAADARESASAGQVREAVDRVRQAARLAPWEPQYVLQEADIYIALQNVRQARNAFARAIERDPRNFPALLNAGRSAWQLGELAEAQRWYALALDVEPQHPDLLSEVARLAIEQGRAADARSLLQRALGVQPGHPTATELLASLQA